MKKKKGDGLPGKTKLDPRALPAKKEGWTIAELAAHFKTSPNVVSHWLSGMRTGRNATKATEGFTVEKIETEARFRIKKRS